MHATDPPPRRAAGTLLLLLTLAGSAATAEAQEPATVVYLVRHAEKAAQPVDDPPLTAAGEARALRLAQLLVDSELDVVYSTDFVRTRATARPVQATIGVEMELYDALELEVLAGTLRDSGRRALVVGHSNTTPELVRLLGGDPGPPIDEAEEYDRLYVVVLPPGGKAVVTLLRFGEPYRAPGGKQDG